MNLTNKTKVVLLSIISILILILTLTYAFMAPIMGNKAKTKVDITAGKLDKLTFIEGDPINLLLNQITLGEGEGNVVGSTSSSAKLVANDATNEAEAEYDIYFDITKNEFFYTTDEEIPEMILTIKDPNNNNITSIEGLTYISGDISGFDITDKKGKFLVKEGHIITTTSSTTGTIETWIATITFINLETDQGDIEGMGMSANLVLQEPELSFGDIILANNGGRTYIETKSHAFNTKSEDNDGMYAMDDDYTATTGNKSYYFRGAVDNNWVKFGKENGNDIWWRIVRINGDESVKLVYTGTIGPQDETEKVVMLENTSSPYTKTQIGTSAFNTLYNRAEYIGYMYELNEHRGHEEDSTIKDFIDTWYEDNLLDYEEYLSDFVVCNDRGFQNNWVPVRWPTSGEGTQYSEAYTRNRPLSGDVSTPTLICPDKEDAYTTSDNIKGNGKLTYPIGLLTADELTLAGAYRVTTNTAYYLYTGQAYWLVSPFMMNPFFAYEFYVDSAGGLFNNYVHDLHGVRPVISILSEVTVTGSGLWNDPYVVE